MPIAEWDGVSRAEALRRLLALADQEPPQRIWALRFWWQRLRALVRWGTR